MFSMLEFGARTALYDFQHIMRMALEPGAMRDTAYCHMHNTECRHEKGDGHSAGPPCTDHTCWGQCRRLSGPTVIPLALWLGLRVLLKEAWILVENVPSWPLDIVSMP